MIKRKNYAKIKECFVLPNLIDIQHVSYRKLLQLDVAKGKRKPVGLEGLFKEMFPIQTQDKAYSLEYMTYTIGKPKYTIEEALVETIKFYQKYGDHIKRSSLFI